MLVLLLALPLIPLPTGVRGFGVRGLLGTAVVDPAGLSSLTESPTASLLQQCPIKGYDLDFFPVKYRFKSPLVGCYDNFIVINKRRLVKI